MGNKRVQLYYIRKLAKVTGSPLLLGRCSRGSGRWERTLRSLRPPDPPPSPGRISSAAVLLQRGGESAIAHGGANYRAAYRLCRRLGLPADTLLVAAAPLRAAGAVQETFSMLHPTPRPPFSSAHARILLGCKARQTPFCVICQPGLLACAIQTAQFFKSH